MKKYILILGFVFLLFFSACSKTEVDEELEFHRDVKEDLTEKDYKDIEEDGDDEFEKDYIDEYSKAVDDKKVKENYDLAVELNNSKDLKKEGKEGKFSCNMIEESSICIEYYGSFMQESQVKMGCDGLFSTNPCPTDMIGGCNTGVGTEADMVSWMYLRGGGGITKDSIKYAKLACNSTIASNWISK